MKRKLIYLPNKYSKDVVDNINGYFDKGYEIEDIFNANEGIYILLVLKDKYKYSQARSNGGDNGGNPSDFTQDLNDFMKGKKQE